MYTLDTNAIIYFLKGDVKAVRKLRNILGKDIPIYVSAITEIELFGYSDLGAEEAALIEDLLGRSRLSPWIHRSRGWRDPSDGHLA